MTREQAIKIINRRWPDLNVKLSHIDWLRSTAKWVLTHPE